MMQSTQRHAEKDAGTVRSGRYRRARGWIMALALLGLGPAGGALATVVPDASARSAGHREISVQGYGHAFHAPHTAQTTHTARASERGRPISAPALQSAGTIIGEIPCIEDIFLMHALNELHTQRMGMTRGVAMWLSSLHACRSFAADRSGPAPQAR